MVKNILVVGDLGAGANIVKNLLLLGNYDWPLKADKFQTLCNQYRRDLKLSQWLSQEYVLRYWQKYYNIDLSDNLDFELYQNTCPKTDLPIIFINHSAFYQPEEFEKFSQHMHVLFVAPETKFGLEWQIRAYLNKKGLDQLHDFCFQDNKQSNKELFIADNGVDAYHQLNVVNMKEIIELRQKDFLNQIPPDQFLSLECVLNDPAHVLSNFFNQKFDQNIDPQQLETLLTKWRTLHWPLDQTELWDFHDLFL